MPDLSTIYEKQHLKNIARTGDKIILIFEGAILEISYVASYVAFKGGIFSLSRYPALKQKVEELLLRMHGELTVTIVNSIKESWDLSNEKNNRIVDKRLA